MQHTPCSMAAIKQRAVDRVRVDLHAFIAFGGGPETPVFVHDLSNHGFRCDSSETLAIGSKVMLRLPKLGQFPATIAWQLGVSAGARFDKPLALSTVMAVVLAVVEQELGTDVAEQPIGDAA